MSEDTKNDFLLAHFAVNCELKKIQAAMTVIVQQQEKLTKILYPKPIRQDGNWHSTDTQIHD